MPNPQSKLIECDDCYKKISPNAQSCPHCGAPRKKRDFISKEFLAVLGIFQALIIISLGFLGGMLERRNTNFIEEFRSATQREISTYGGKIETQIEEIRTELGKKRMEMERENERNKILKENIYKVLAKDDETSVQAICLIYGIYGDKSIEIFRRMLEATRKLEKGRCRGESIKVARLKKMLNIAKVIQKTTSEWGVRISYGNRLIDALQDEERVRDKFKDKVKIYRLSESEYYVFVTDLSEELARSRSGDINSELQLNTTSQNFSMWKEKLFDEKGRTKLREVPIRISEMTPLAQVAYQECLTGPKEIGTSNEGPEIEKYQKPLDIVGRPWSAAFLYWCVDKTGVKLPPKKFNLASTSTWVDWAKNNGYWHSVKDKSFIPTNGDIVIYSNSKRPGEFNHSGIILEYYKESKIIITVEGNVNNKVSEVHRKLPGTGQYTVAGFIRITAEPAKPGIRENTP